MQQISPCPASDPPPGRLAAQRWCPLHAPPANSPLDSTCVYLVPTCPIKFGFLRMDRKNPARLLNFCANCSPIIRRRGMMARFQAGYDVQAENCYSTFLHCNRGLAGLRNLGNTCFLSSCSAVPDLLEAFMAHLREAQVLMFCQVWEVRCGCYSMCVTE